ncbi:MAG TPA: dihydrofolate reductase family protein [Polyangiaceae bacterium]|nr:dihydrofolate reductase family protein [Polyangiaceae bacterium]
MAKLNSFTNVTLDGYFADRDGEMGFFHEQDPEWTAFTEKNASGGGALLFGRKTYEMMASFWPTDMARKQMPVVADKMNRSRKFVVSRTLGTAPWENTQVLAGELATEIRRLKSSDMDVAILGSGSLVAQLAALSLIDELTLAVHPLVLGRGKNLFEGVQQRFPLRLAKTRAFGNGTIVSTYVPAR